MRKSVSAKLAASTLVLGVTMVGCTPANQGRIAAASSKEPQAEQDASRLYASAQLAVQQGKAAEALDLTEKAVELAPRDLGYRMLLGDLYLKNGRFQSAETAFRDVLQLDADNARAAFNLALTQIALGKVHAATAHLERLAQTEKPSDVGLAFALAGDPQRAIDMLEPAARAPEADGRVRQNLALAYALAGDWLKARTTAAQDVSPIQLASRMEQWAAFARPQQSWSQVASLLGVTPQEDPGQPVRLALAPAAPEPVQLAEATPVQAAETVLAEMTYAPAPEPANLVESKPVPVAVPDTQYAEVVQSLVETKPELVRASATVSTTPVPAFVPAAEKPRIAGRIEHREAKRAELSAKPSRFVVQIGAYRTAGGAEKAWASAIGRYPLAAERVPMSTTVSIPGKGTFHRLSVSGFETRAEAIRLCGSIRAKGGTCFVRETAGDAPVRWASRYTRNS